MSSSQVTVLSTGILIASLLCAGCGDSGPALVGAGGTVSYRGQPLPKASVVFVPEGSQRTAFATTDEQGQFMLTTDGSPGAGPGSYKVAVTAIRLLREVPEEEAIAMSNEQIYANQENLIPEKYNNVISSGLTADVGDDPANNQYTFDLQ